MPPLETRYRLIADEGYPMSRTAAPQDQFHDEVGIGVHGEGGTDDVQHEEADLIISLLATGLIQAHRQVFYGAPLSVPHPPGLQRGLDHLSLAAAIRSRVPAPAGVPELVHWCHEPVRSWPVALTARLQEPSPASADIFPITLTKPQEERTAR